MLHVDCVDRHPSERFALDDTREVYTFGDVAEMSRRLASHLRHAEGVAPGERVAVVLGQRLDAALLHVACSRIGAITTPLSPLFGEEGLATRLADAQPALVVTTSAHAAVVERALALAAMPAIPVRRVDDALFEARWTSCRELARDEEARGGPDAPLTLVYTSGTTAKPKGALLPQRVVAGRMSGFLLAHEPFDDAVFWSPADWSWIGGLHDSLFAPWHEAALVVAQERHGHLDAAQTWRLLAEREVTDAFLPPTALKTLMRSGLAPPRRLRSVHSAGEPLPGLVAAWARGALADVVTEVFGLTECAFLVGTAARAYETPAGSMGKPFPTHRVVVADEEICVEQGDPTMMLGYWCGPDEPPRLPLDEKGRLRTGDLAREEGGFLWLLGRKDDLIKTSGYRVGPAEVEASLLHHPAVAECAVVGVPDEARGQRVKAFVKRVPGYDVDAAELMAFVKERLAAHAYPREVEFMDELPTTVSGKLKRRELRGA